MQEKLIKTENKIKDLERAIVLLEQSNQRLKTDNLLKDEFISIATHQIRGPLGAIKGYISLILEGDYGDVPNGLAEPLGIILKSTDSMGKTVNDFLDVSRIEQGEMKYYLKDFNLVDLVNEAVNEMKTLIHTDGLELKLNITDEPIMIHGDKAKLKHVLVNLIDNANKYTRSGFIQISLKKKGQSKAVFSVKDSGLGINKDTIPHLFKKFTRGSDAGSTNIHGTGLGLFVARKLVEAQKGKIWAESEGEGKGSQFYVELDLVK